MHDPDWDRYEVHSRATDTTGKSHTPLGDPTRWGALSTVNVQPITGFQDLVAPQVLRVQCTDNYSRPWAIVGTIRAPLDLWNAGPIGPSADSWNALLVVRMGVGQNTIEHDINLRAVIEADAPFYFESESANEFLAGFRVRPFVISGGLIGNALAVTVRHVVRFSIAPAPADRPITTAVQLTPFNAGTGL